ncbi:MAG: Crp/Fnr family transcriptional regulator [Deltaproteobacteria bacterium]|nr:Crp/Fnr family transcriptional regulator [Deltaproteobacteria bacterium]
MSWNQTRPSRQGAPAPCEPLHTRCRFEAFGVVELWTAPRVGEIGHTMPLPTKVDVRRLLGGLSFFADLSAADLDGLVAVTSTRLYSAREIVFREGDPGDAAFVVSHGWLKVVATGPDGQEATLSLMGAGEAFGELAILDGGPRSATVMALEPSLLVVLERAPFHELLRQSPTLAYKMLLVTSRRLRSLSERVEDVEFLDVPARLAKKLVELSRRHGSELEDGRVRIKVKLSQRELGQMIGATRESTNKHLKLLEEHGLVEQKAGIMFVKPKGLQDLAEQGSARVWAAWQKR